MQSTSAPRPRSDHAAAPKHPHLEMVAKAPVGAPDWQSDCVGDFVAYHARQRPEAVAMRSRGTAPTRPKTKTWAQLAHQSQALATGLLNMGVAVQDRVCVLAKTRAEHCVINLALAQVGAVSVPIYAGSVAKSCQYIADNAQASVIFADDAAEVAKFYRDGVLPSDVRVVQIEGEIAGGDGQVVALGDLLNTAPDEAALARRRTQMDNASLLSIVYTSGTTGEPKGVMVTHANVLYVAHQLQGILRSTRLDVQLMFLPMAHVFAKLVEVSWLVEGHLLAFADIQRFKEDLADAKPTILGAVPRLLEKLHAGVWAKAAANRLLGPMLTSALGLSAKNSLAKQKGEALPLRDRVLYLLARATVFPLMGAGLRRATGGALRMIVSGGAPLSAEVAGLINDLLRVDVLEGYGLTESCGASSINRPGATQVGTVGLPLPQTSIKVAEGGELLIKGPGVMRGYWNNAQATNAAFTEGWLRTGDLGHIDAQQVVRITGREKDLIITSGGKNVAPQNIEAAIKSASTLIGEAVVFGDRQKYLTVAVTLDPANLAQGLVTHASEDPAIRQQVQDVIDAVNATLERYQTLKRFVILDTVFSEANGLLTPTAKVRRREVYKQFHAQFCELYGDDWMA